MPYPAKHKQESRKRILESAARLFLHQGYERTAINEIMQDAGMTHGAFYAHFKSKSDLYDKAMTFAAKNGQFTSHLNSDKRGNEWLEDLFEEYLSMSHVQDTEIPCPLAFLVTDMATSEVDVRNTYTRIYKKMNRFIGRYSGKSSYKSSDDVYAVTALMIGGLALSRAVDDKQLVERILESCRHAASRLANRE